MQILFTVFEKRYKKVHILYYILYRLKASSMRTFSGFQYHYQNYTV